MMMASVHHTNRHTTDLCAVYYIITQSKDRERKRGKGGEEEEESGYNEDEITTSLFNTYCYGERKRVIERKEKNFVFFSILFFLLSKRVKRSLNCFLSSMKTRSTERRRWKCHFCLCFRRKGWASHILFTVTSSTSKERETEKTKKRVIITRLRSAVREKEKGSQGKLFAIFLDSYI